jgi:hypothetical protein
MPRKRLPKTDLLALAVTRSTPEWGAWQFGREPAPSLHSPQNISRLLGFHADRLAISMAGLVQAKEAVFARRWDEADRLIESALSELGLCVQHRGSLARLIRQAAREDAPLTGAAAAGRPTKGQG